MVEDKLGIKRIMEVMRRLATISGDQVQTEREVGLMKLLSEAEESEVVYLVRFV